MALHGVSALQAKENGKPMGLSKGFNNCELFSVVSLLPQKAVTLWLFFLGGGFGFVQSGMAQVAGSPSSTP